MAMANNVRRLRVALLLTPRQLAARMGADPSDVERIEAEDFALSDDWIDAVARALRVPLGAVTAAHVDYEEIRGLAKTAAKTVRLPCPVATRFAILAIVAKFAGVKYIRRLDEDDVARAVQGAVAFVGEDRDFDKEGDFNRLTLALRIAALAILQSRDFAPSPHFEGDLEEVLQGSAEMIRRYSRIAPEPAS
jgi:transcriptional regulator with XRE-family HTH domain